MRYQWLLAPLFLGACGGGELSVDGLDGSDVSTATLRARAGETTVWVNETLVRRAGADGRTELTISGRTSRNLTDGTVFVFDDPYGRFEQLSARRFLLGFATTELASLVSGVQTFVRLHFLPSASRPEILTGRIIAAPRLADFTGSGIFLVAEPEVVTTANGLAVRIVGSSNRGLLSVAATAGGAPVADARLLSPRAIEIDLPMDRAIELAGSNLRLEVRATSATGALTKTARLDLRVLDFALTDGDPSVVWPPPAPSIVDDVALQAAFARADLRIQATLRPDALALVGAERTEVFLDNALRTSETRLEPYFGNQYASATERDQALDREIELGIDAVYARPLDEVDPLLPLGNDPVRARNYAADALLLHLSTFDTASSEWGRPLEELTRMFRAQHVAAVGDLRQVGTIVLSTPTEDIYTTNWLGALVEVTILRSTGEIVYLLFEID